MHSSGNDAALLAAASDGIVPRSPARSLWLPLHAAGRRWIGASTHTVLLSAHIEYPYPRLQENRASHGRWLHPGWKCTVRMFNPSRALLCSEGSLNHGLVGPLCSTLENPPGAPKTNTTVQSWAAMLSWCRPRGNAPRACASRLLDVGLQSDVLLQEMV
jgi:hypothetical protein